MNCQQQAHANEFTEVVTGLMAFALALARANALLGNRVISDEGRVSRRGAGTAQVLCKASSGKA